ASSEERRRRGHRVAPIDRRAKGCDCRSPEFLRSEDRRAAGTASIEAENDGGSGRAGNAGRGLSPRPRTLRIRARREDREDPEPSSVVDGRWKIPFSSRAPIAAKTWRS